MRTIGSIGQSMGVQDMAAMREKMFEKADSDKDGKLSKTELEEAMKKMAEEHGGAPSTGGDALSIDEIFGKLDANGDGSLDIDEMDGMKDIMPKPPDGKNGPPGGMTGSPAEQISINDLSKTLQDLFNAEDGSYDENALNQYLTSMTNPLTENENAFSEWQI